MLGRGAGAKNRERLVCVNSSVSFYGGKMKTAILMAILTCRERISQCINLMATMIKWEVDVSGGLVNVFRKEPIWQKLQTYRK
jgi:hypothetical protein